MSTTAVDTGTGVAPPPSGPVGTAFTEASGYALEVHNDFWAEVPSDKRRKSIKDFTSKAKQAGVSSQTAKAWARDLGVETPDYKTAAQVMVGYKAFECNGYRWIGPGPIGYTSQKHAQSGQRRPEKRSQDRRRGRPRSTIRMRNHGSSN